MNVNTFKLLFTSVPLTVFGAGYLFYRNKQIGNPDYEVLEIKSHKMLTIKPNVPISRTMKGSPNSPNLDLTLFQYPTCPFCCKVRAFLDYYGLPYDVVEVNPVLKQQTCWTTYNKVPILLAKVDNGYQQLIDSSMIISALKSYIVDGKNSLEEIVKNYPISHVKGSGLNKEEILNKYFLMYGENFDSNQVNSILEEKKWREWVDNSFVHVLSPNVYRTYIEALQSFKWFSKVGEWDQIFPTWERIFIVYVGAASMNVIGKRLKAQHKLKDDVRESLYDGARKWMKALDEKKTQFMGGDHPNLADLAMYGVLSSIEGCSAFNDLLEKTSIRKWFYPIRRAVENHEGCNKLNIQNK